MTIETNAHSSRTGLNPPRQDITDIGIPFADLAKEIKAKADGRKIIYLQNPGNFGDSLINFGAMLFFRDYGIDIEFVPLEDRAAKVATLFRSLASVLWQKRLMVYGGSGGWSNATYIASRVVRLNATINNNILVLPSSYEAFSPPDNVVAYSRDKYESLSKLKDKRFCHDMAFYLAVTSQQWRPKSSADKQKLGLMFRIDNEARDHGFAKLAGNKDLSATGSHSDDPTELLRQLDTYDIIATDRLHIAIGATLLGKIVYMLPGNYFKITAIYNSSIAPFFDNCSLVSDSEMATILSEHGVQL